MKGIVTRIGQKQAFLIGQLGYGSDRVNHTQSEVWIFLEHCGTIWGSIYEGDGNFVATFRENNHWDEEGSSVVDLRRRPKGAMTPPEVGNSNK